MLAPSYIASVALILSQVLPLFGITVESKSLEITIQTIIAIGTGLVVGYRQLTSGRSNVFGGRPKHFAGR